MMVLDASGDCMPTLSLSRTVDREVGFSTCLANQVAFLHLTTFGADTLHLITSLRHQRLLKFNNVYYDCKAALPMFHRS